MLDKEFELKKEHLGKEIKCLDKGYVRLVDFMGSDSAIVQAARTSTGQGIKTPEEDRDLLRYLVRHQHCYHPDMEVLTIEGWKKWKNCNEYETFLVPLPEQKKLQKETLKVKKFFVQNEKMYNFNNSKMSYSVTSNHRMYFKNKYKKFFEIVEAQNMLKWGHFHPLKGLKMQEENDNPDVMYMFLGFFLGDGNFPSANRWNFHLVKKRKKAYLKYCMSALNLDYKEINGVGSKKNYWIVLTDEIKKLYNFHVEEGKSFKLETLKGLSYSQIRGLWLGLVNSDGSLSSSRPQITFSSTTKSLNNLFMALSAFQGIDAHVIKQGENIHSSNAYVGNKNTLESRKQYHSNTDYTGNVFCATTSSGLLVVRGGHDKFGFLCGNSSPLEMVEFKFHVKLPIFVARQNIRHRTACLSGDTELWFDAPKSFTKQNLYGRFRPYIYKMTLNEFFRKWTINRKKKGKGQNQYSLDKMFLRSVNEETQEIYHTSVKDVWQSGEKDVFELELEGGYKIKTSKDHLFFTDSGWKKLEDFTQLKNTEVKFWDSEISIFTNGIPVYQNKEWLYDQYWVQRNKIQTIANQANVSYHTIRKWLKVFGLQESANSKERKRSPSQLGEGSWNKGKRYRLNLTPEQHENRSKKAKQRARRGEKSNFWKGGTTSRRQNIGRWTTEQLPRLLKKYNYKCAISGQTGDLVAHHIDPVFNSLEKSCEFDNLILLHRAVHQRIHANHLEFALMQWIKDNKDLETFFDSNNVKLEAPSHKYKFEKRKTYLSVKKSKIVAVKYVGKEMTYDVEVDGPYHNFIANGVTVHNSVNEFSGRYSEMPNECFVPEPERLRKQGKFNKQGSEQEVVEDSGQICKILEKEQKQIFANYNSLIDQEVAREIARINLPVSTYTNWYWKMDLRNLFHMLNLRMDEHAQEEIQVYARAMYNLIKPIVPVACEAFEDYIFQAKTFSRQEVDAIRSLINKKECTQALKDIGLSKRERKEFFNKMGDL